jgi:hypothetical protein
MGRDDLRAVAADLGVTVIRGDSKEAIRLRIAAAAAAAAEAGAPEPNGLDGFTCDCGARLPWPAEAEDVTCPACGTAWEHDGVSLGGGARIKQQPSCHYCGRTGQQLAPCCERPEHEHQLACVDVAGCRDVVLAQLQEQNDRFDAAEARFGTALQKPDSGAVSTALTERLELLGSMDAEDARTALAFIARHAPAAFDAAVAELLDLGDDEDQGDADEEPFCSACGASIGIFYGRGNAWLHYRGQGTAASPVELFDAGHEPVIAWRPAGAPARGAGLVGRLVEDACDDSPCPVVGLVVGQVDEDTLEVLWGDRRFEDNPGPGSYEPIDALRPARDGAR